jgi:hypothetical protein
MAGQRPFAPFTLDGKLSSVTKYNVHAIRERTRQVRRELARLRLLEKLARLESRGTRGKAVRQ